ncbi:cell division protein FtsK [Bacillus infantis]|uniref:FtsK/SpoIIIE domain-containing protein n=1 Tax=Bacillus infantis TaxID=324767 RepID=UPI00101C0CFD|nr:FtsK/SpoIIIE domain-containing protein [Bacillus infantis]RYI24988.1 cell division protein FtsK [Bacillus infantis]
MIVEVLTSFLAAGILGSSFIYQQGGGGNDHKKIETIAANSGLISKDKKSIRIHRRTKQKGYTEYVYQMPQGLSEKDFKDKLHRFQDGLNIKRTVLDITMDDIKGLKLNKTLPEQIQDLLKKKRELKKEVEISFDGMLIFRVYDEPLTTEWFFNEKLAKKCKGWNVPVGLSRKGLIFHDFEKKSHIIVAGTTDFGKSNWVNCTINTLLYTHPEDVSFTLIDLKGGLEFNRYRHLKQVKAYASNVEEAQEALTLAVEEMDRVTEHLLEKGYSNVKEAGFKGRHFIVIDEAADMADDAKCQELLKDIARKGRASGLRLIYTTQYPTAETISSQVKRNCIGRLCFVLDTSTASNVVLDQSGAENLPLIQGRALYKDVKLIEVQAPYITSDEINKFIKPHINIRPRRDSNEETGTEGKPGGKHSLVIKETPLSN